MSGLFFVILSAFFHACWNILLKKARSKFRFNLNMHLASVVLFTILLLLFYPEEITFDGRIVLVGLLGAMFFATYHLLITKAYQYSDVSQVYPITNSSPLFVALWATFFLKEFPSKLGIIGIIVTIVGCLILNGASLKNTRFEKGVLIAFLAAFAYSFGAIFDKLGVNTGHAIMYTYYMNTFMALFFWLLFKINTKKEPVAKEDRKWIWPAGVILVLSAVTYRIGLIDIPLSYGVAIRQVSGLFGLLMGIILFKEGYGKTRLVGTLIIVAGVILVRLTI